MSVERIRNLGGTGYVYPASSTGYPVMRSIYRKILLWLWIVVIGTAAVVMLFASLSGAQPRAYFWMSLATGVYAQGAVDHHLQGGNPALAQFIRDVESAHGIRAPLLDPQNRDILGKAVPGWERSGELCNHYVERNGVWRGQGISS